MNTEELAVFVGFVGLSQIAGIVLLLVYFCFCFVSFLLSARFTDYKASTKQIALMTVVCTVLVAIPKLGTWLSLLAYVVMLWNISTERIVQMFIVSILMPVALLLVLSIVLNQF